MSDLGFDLQNDETSPPARRRPPVGTRTLLISIVLVVLVGVVGAAYFAGHRLVDFFTTAPDYSNSGYGSVIVQVHDGDTASDIAQTLFTDHVVKSSAAFRDAADSNSKSRLIEPGFYRLHLHMKASLALSLMLDPSSLVRSRVVVREGASVTEVVNALVQNTKLRRADIVAALNSPTALGLPAYARGHVEGFLFPATYDVNPNDTASEVLSGMVDRFNTAAADVNLVAGAARIHETPYAVLIVASLVEAEAKFPQDYGKVARVVYNRLAHGMPLQLDATLNYALNAHKVFISLQDTKLRSPYNTYLHAGLPPTPIDSPGEAAMRAALNPTAGDWLYFVTIDKAGHNAFTDNYQQFLRLKQQSERNRR